MSLSPARPLSPWRWIGLPALVVLGVTVLFMTPIRVFGLQPPEPIFAMVPAFAWAVIRPSILAPLALLMLGLTMDLLWGNPAGLWPLSLLLAYGLTLSIRNILAGQGPGVMWTWFAIACLLAEVSGVLITKVMTGTLPSFLAVFWQLSVTSLLYPFTDWLIDRFRDADVRFG